MRSDCAWIETVINHKETDSVPYNFAFSPPIEKALIEHFRSDQLENALRLPIRMTAPESIKPLFADPAVYGDTIRDEFDVIWSTNKIDRGSPIGIPLKSPSLKGYRFPDAALPERFKHIEQWSRKQAGHFRIIWVGDLWERATFMRGMENLLLDVALNQSFVEALLEGITEYILQTMEILFDRFQFEAIALSDDYGTQKAMLINLDDWRRLVKPCLKKIYAAAKNAGRKVFHHSCGNIVDIIADMIDVGLDILHPIQPEAMDIYELKKRFGSDVTFCGGMPTQRILPDGTPAQVRAAVRQIKAKMSKGGGYIFEPGITVQADVPVANVLAMIDEAWKS